MRPAVSIPGYIPELDAARLDEAARTFASVGHVRIERPFLNIEAEALFRHLDSEVDWWRTFNQGEKLWDLGPDSIAALDPQKKAAIEQAIHEGAKKGFQLYYDTVRVSEDPAERQARGWLLDRLMDGLNSEAGLQLFRDITGEADIQMADGQATRYLPGHFLTAHDDAFEGKNRLVAYVLSLTPHWDTNWGGLLQFHDDFGDIVHALRPCFNAIHLFRIPSMHSVSLVTPFAEAPRYSVTGWLRRKAA